MWREAGKEETRGLGKLGSLLSVLKSRKSRNTEIVSNRRWDPEDAIESTATKQGRWLERERKSNRKTDLIIGEYGIIWRLSYVLRRGGQLL